jgi:di/tricarboxylate transporter
LRELSLRSKYGFAAIALLRRGRSHRTDVASLPLETGDSLLLVGKAERLNDLRLNANLIVLEPDASTLPIPRGRAAASVLIFLSAILMAVLGFPIVLSILTAALIGILSGLLPLQQAYRSIDWQVIIFAAGMYAASSSIVHTGIAAGIGGAAGAALSQAHPLVVAGASFLLAAAVAQLMGSQATAFLVGPITISTALQLNINPHAVAVATAIGCCASFLTPLAHPVNLIVMSPGNYQPADFARAGWGLMLVTLVTLAAAMVVFWGF